MLEFESFLSIAEACKVLFLFLFTLCHVMFLSQDLKLRRRHDDIDHSGPVSRFCAASV